MKISKILVEMDVIVLQVVLATVIGELTLNQDEEFGVDYFIRANKKYAATTNFTCIPPFAGGGINITSPAPRLSVAPLDNAVLFSSIEAAYYATVSAPVLRLTM